MNLVQRQVLQEDKCEFCQRCLETVIHTLWDCGAAQDVWAGSVAWIQKSGGKFDDFMQLFQVMMAKLSMEELETFLVQSWLIWHRRNTVLYGSKMQHPGQLKERVTDLLREYREAQSSLAVLLVRPSSLQNWKPLAGQLFKLNLMQPFSKMVQGWGRSFAMLLGRLWQLYRRGVKPWQTVRKRKFGPAGKHWSLPLMLGSRS